MRGDMRGDEMKRGEVMTAESGMRGKLSERNDVTE
jgi:hypothetical protein